jgi:hypothetical protein
MPQLNCSKKVAEHAGKGGVKKTQSRCRRRKKYKRTGKATLIAHVVGIDVPNWKMLRVTLLLTFPSHSSCSTTPPFLSYKLGRTRLRMFEHECRETEKPFLSTVEMSICFTIASGTS